MEKKCPFCGAPLPSEAVFCPSCAKSINSRIHPGTPRYFPRRFLKIALGIFLAVTVCAGIFLLTRPKTYSGIGEVTYTDQDGTYQILTNVSTDRYYPMTEIFQDAGEQESYRFPLRLYINHKNTGADASGMFLQKVKSANLHIQQDTESSSHAEFSPPQPLKESFPGTALVSYINFNKNCASPTRFIWTLSMENGDTIRLGIDLIITPIQTYHYSAENADLSDSAALQALIDRQQAGELGCGQIGLVLSSRPGVYALERAQKAGIETVVVDRKSCATAEEFSARVLHQLQSRGVEMVVLAGFLSILCKDMVEAYPNRIINVHPSLIPSFCGKGFYGLKVHQAALDYGVKVTGATVHYVNEVTDGGSIILQKAVYIEPDDTPETLQRRVMEQAEWELLPKATAMVCQRIQEEKDRQ